MAGTGGLRKLRFAPPTWRIGKRGATRVSSVHFPAFEAVYLVVIVGKKEQPKLTRVDRNAFATLMPRLRRDLEDAQTAKKRGRL